MAIITSNRETSCKHIIQVDVDPPTLNNMQVGLEPQEEPNSNTKIDHRREISGGVKDFILACDREQH